MEQTQTYNLRNITEIKELKFYIERAHVAHSRVWI